MNGGLQRERRASAPIRWVAAAVFVVLAVPMLNPYLSPQIDDAVCMLLARSLANGWGYRDIAYVGAPPHVYLPFGFQLLLTPAARLLPDSVVAHKVIVLLCGLGFVLASGWVAHRDERGLARQTMLLTAVSPLALSFSTNIWNDMAYGLAILLGLHAYRRAATASARRLAWAMIAVSTLVAAYFVHVAALGLFVAASLYLLLRRRWALCAASAVALGVTAGAWEVRNHRIAGAQPTVYADHYSKFSSSPRGRQGRGLTATLRRGLTAAKCQSWGVAGAIAPLAFASELGDDCFPYFRFYELWAGPAGAKWPRGLVVLCVLLVATGWISKVVTRLDVRDLYFASYLGLLAFAGAGDVRQMCSVLPFLFYYALAATDLIGRLRPVARRTLFVALLGVNLLGSLSLASLHVRGQLAVAAAPEEALVKIYPDDWAAHIAAARRLAQRARRQAVVMCCRGYAEVLHLVCGLRMLALPEDLAPSQLLAFAEARADFAIVARGRRRRDMFLWHIERGRSPALRIAFTESLGETQVCVVERRAARAGPDRP